MPELETPFIEMSHFSKKLRNRDVQRVKNESCKMKMKVSTKVN